MMVVMVMMSARGMRLHRTFHLVAMLALCLGFNGNVTDAMLPKLLAHLLLDGMRFPTDHNVHRGVMVLSVHAPGVNVVNVLYTINLQNVRLDLIHINAFRDPFQKQRKDLL